MHNDRAFAHRLIRAVCAVVMVASGVSMCTSSQAAPSAEYKAAAAEYKRLCALDAECTEKAEAKREQAAQRRLARKLAEIRALRDAQEGPKSGR